MSTSRASHSLGNAASRVFGHAALDAPDYLDRVCACTVCVNVVGKNMRDFKRLIARERPTGSSRDFPTQESQGLSTAHYLLARQAEIEYLRSTSLAQLRQDLVATATSFSDLFVPRGSVFGRSV